MDLPDQVQLALETLANFERSREEAVEHLLAQLSPLDANLKLLRRANSLPQLELQSSLRNSAYQFPFSQAGTQLFGEGLKEILALNEQLSTKGYTCTVERAVVKALSKGSATSTMSS